MSADREKVLAGMVAVMGEVPREREGLGRPVVEVREVVKGEGYERRTIAVESLFGERVTAYLYVPVGLREGEKRPGMVVMQSTGEAGKVIVDGTGPKGARLGFARELAVRGYVVVSPDYPSFGEQREYDFKTSKFVSGTMKAICDNMRCVDLLQSMGEVNRERIGALGHSLGGHNALFTAAFDERIKAVVTSCGWTPFHFYYGGKKLGNWAQDRYMPRVREVYGNDPDKMPFDFAGVSGAGIAPRGVFSNSPVGDENFEVAGVREAEGEIRKAYERIGAGGRFVVKYPGYGHEFGEGERREAYEFLDRELGLSPVRRVP